MSDLRTRLGDLLASYVDDSLGFASVPPLVAALRAVVELHAPDSELPNACAECCCSSTPCSTIRLITDQLGLTQDQEQHREGGDRHGDR